MPNSNSRLLYILTRYPYPITTGRHKMLDQNIRILSKSFDISILFFEHDKFDESKGPWIDQERLKLPSLVTTFWNILFRRGYSMQEALYFSRVSKKKIEGLLNTNNFKVVICDMIRTAQYVEDYPIKKVLDIDDLLSLRYRRALTQADFNFNLFGSLQSRKLRFIQKIVGPFVRIILKREANLIERRETDLLKKFSATYFVSNSEAMMMKSAKAFWVPPMVKTHDNVFNINSMSKPSFLFLGNFLTNQNQASLRQFIVKLIPLLCEEIGQYEFYLVGKVDGTTRNLLEDVKNNIKILGFVDDLEEVMRKTTLAIMPISFGTGIKTKILDCMSYGVPVITNRCGIEGINVKDNYHLKVRETPLEIKNEIVSLWKNPDELEMLSKNAYSFVKENFREEVVSQRLAEVIASVDH